MLREHLAQDLPDPELKRLIDDADAEVLRRCGSHRIDAPLTDVLRGGSVKLFPDQAVEAITSVTETVADVSTTLSHNDYQIWHGGRMLERLSSGAHPRGYWGDRVEIQYTPVDTDAQRRMAIIRLVHLGIQYSGLQSESVGPYSRQSRDYTREREAILTALAQTNNPGIPI